MYETSLLELDPQEKRFAHEKKNFTHEKKKITHAKKI